MTSTTLRRVKPRAYGVVGPSQPPPNYYAFFDQGGGQVLAALYRDGDWVSDRATVDSGLGASTWGTQATTLIHSDSQGLVGDGSLVLPYDSFAGLAVLDPENDAAYSYDGEAGAYFAGGAAYDAGWLWWVEMSTSDVAANTRRFRLLQARADLTNRSVVSSRDVAILPSRAWGDLQPSEVHPATLYAIADHNDGEVTRYQRVRFPRAGGSSDQEGGGFVNSVGLPGTGAAALGFVAQRLYQEADDPAGDFSELWPFDVPEISLSLSPDRSEAAAYGFDTALFDYALSRAPVSGTPSQPTSKFVVNPHPQVAAVPTWVFIRE